MILDANKQICFSSNKEAMETCFPDVYLQPMHAGTIIPNANYFIWFNYAAIKKNEEYINPIKGTSLGGDYINIYSNHDEMIEQIVPEGCVDTKLDNIKRIVFKKNMGVGNVFFVGIYELEKRVGNHEFYKRVSKLFDTDNYQIVSTKVNRNYHFVKLTSFIETDCMKAHNSKTFLKVRAIKGAQCDDAVCFYKQSCENETTLLIHGVGIVTRPSYEDSGIKRMNVKLTKFDVEKPILPISNYSIDENNTISVNSGRAEEIGKFI